MQAPTNSLFGQSRGHQILDQLECIEFHQSNERCNKQHSQHSYLLGSDAHQLKDILSHMVQIGIMCIQHMANSLRHAILQLQEPCSPGFLYPASQACIAW